MASLNMFVTPIVVTPHQRRVTTTYATSAKASSSGSSEEKSLLDFVLGKIAKEDQFYETDPILKKVEGKPTTTGTTGRSKTTIVVSPPPKKEGGFGGLGGLFAKK